MADDERHDDWRFWVLSPVGHPLACNREELRFPGWRPFRTTGTICLSVVGGKLAALCRLPALFGMLCFGFAARNIHADTFTVDTSWSTVLRNFALVVILSRAGLGLNLAALRRLSAAVIRLAFLPNLVEAAVDAAIAVALFGMPWTWGLMLGFIISAVSPAVVVPSLLRLQDEGFGTRKGIPTLVLAAASFDDVLSISGFGICLGLSFSQQQSSSLAWDILRAPTEVIVGIVGGIVIGLLCASVGHKRIMHRGAALSYFVAWPLSPGRKCCSFYRSRCTQRHHLWRCCRPSMGQG